MELATVVAVTPTQYALLGYPSMWRVLSAYTALGYGHWV